MKKILKMLVFGLLRASLQCCALLFFFFYEI